jgi:hypothetical protein
MEFHLGFVEHEGKSIIGLYRLDDGYMTVSEIPPNSGLREASPILRNLLRIVHKRSDNLLIEHGKAMGVARIWISGLNYKWHSGPINGNFHEALRNIAQERISNDRWSHQNSTRSIKCPII